MVEIVKKHHVDMKLGHFARQICD